LSLFIAFSRDLGFHETVTLIGNETVTL
jgi:hypothetical protein